MTQDLRSRLTRGLREAAPPTRITTDALIHKGRRRARVRRYALSGGVTAGVAVFAAATLMLQAGLGGGTPNAAGDPSGSPSVDSTADPLAQPEVTLPPIDPQNDYTWAGRNPTTTEESAALDTALWDFLNGRGFDMYVMPDGIESTRPLDPASRPRVQRVDDELGRLAPYMGGWTGEETGYQQPAYELKPNGELLLQLGPEKQYGEYFTFKVFPKGGYLDGPAQNQDRIPSMGFAPHLVGGCDDYTFDSQGTTGKLADYECHDGTTSAGERYLLVDETTSSSGELITRLKTLVLYRADGSAVRLQSSLDCWMEWELRPAGFYQGLEFRMDDANMVALAEALPDVIVK